MSHVQASWDLVQVGSGLGGITSAIGAPDLVSESVVLERATKLWFVCLFMW